MLWIGFLFGKLFHWWLKADAIIRSASNSTSSLSEWANRNRAALATRAAIGAALFYIWTTNPNLASQIMQACATQLSDEGWMGIIRGALAKGSLPLNVVTAAAFGYVIDSLLDKVCAKLPWLREYIPEVNGKTVTINVGDVKVK